MSDNNGFLAKLVLYIPVKLFPALLTICFIFFLYRFFPQGEYVSYSVSITCSLIVAQLSATWVGNSFVYYYSGVGCKKTFFYNCLFLITLIAPFSGSISGLVASFFSNDDGVFRVVWWLCIAQLYFFFMSSVCQAAFLVRQQLAAVILQAAAQIGVICLLLSDSGISYYDAVVSLTAGYGAAGIVMLVAVVFRLGVGSPIPLLSSFRKDVVSIYQYGSALAPWLLGMLIMAGADRFSIGYLQLAGGDAYLSIKDLFVGAGGLVSMPLLMLIHPLIIKRFREGVFEGVLIQNSLAFLVLAFVLLWTLIILVGFDAFERVTGKAIDVHGGVLLIAYVGVFLNCTAVYIQKRLEVHRRMKTLAYLSIFSALTSVVLSYAGGAIFGLYGAAVGVLLGQLIYFAMVGATVFKKINLLRGVFKPFVFSLGAMLVGWWLHVAILRVFEGNPWWVGSLSWVMVFAFVSLLVLWKGVPWREFSRSKLE